MERPTKYIFVTGGVVSSLGKGIAAASIGNLLVERGFRVTIQKFDPYLNFDPGTMSPFEHGEVFVTEDGAETDLDLGHYERFLDRDLSQANNLTQGRILWTVLEKERRGDFLGGTVQMIPHVTNEIKDAIRRVSNGVDVVITEIGGTIGDIESLPFLESLRQYTMEVGRENVLFVHLTLVPFIKAAGELKTKPTQQTVKDLQGLGIQPDVLLCRTEQPLPEDMKRKIAMFTNVEPHCVVEALDVAPIYAIPLRYRDQDLDGIICRKLGLPDVAPEMKEWREIIRILKKPTNGRVHIAIVGKYTQYADSYKSLKDALMHGGIANDVGVEVYWLPAEAWETGESPDLNEYDGVLVPGGFGERGVEGMIRAVSEARDKKIPFLGICLGMQVAVIERARSAGVKDAYSAEFSNELEHPVIHLMENQHGVANLGGTLRLGSYVAQLQPGSKTAEIYGSLEISERHRHRYEVNNQYREVIEQAGLKISGTSPDNLLVEFVEDAEPGYWFVATQAHPELKSRPKRPHPLFRGFIGAALKNRDR